MITIRHEFYEKATGYKYPIVTHEFRGETLDEARRYFKAHQTFDRMLAATSTNYSEVVEGSFLGIKYRSVIRFIQE